MKCTKAIHFDWLLELFFPIATLTNTQTNRKYVPIGSKIDKFVGGE